MVYNGYGYHPQAYYPQAYYPYSYQQPVYPYMEEPIHPPSPEERDAFERQGDHGGEPYVVDIEEAAERNRAFRRAIWTGRHLQVTLMRLMPGEDIGLEVHPNTDQFLRIEDGHGVVQMGDQRNQLYFERLVSEDDAIFIPAGKWHNLRNTGRRPLELYSIYAPPEHPRGTVHRTKQEAIAHHRSDEST